jgi:glycerophosphoryl diester phosphodiesterase
MKCIRTSIALNRILSTSLQFTRDGVVVLFHRWSELGMKCKSVDEIFFHFKIEANKHQFSCIAQ